MQNSLVLSVATAAGISMMSMALAQTPAPEPAMEDASVIEEPMVEAAPVEEAAEMSSTMAGPECVNGYATLGNGVIILCGERPLMETAATTEPAAPMEVVPDASSEAGATMDEAPDGGAPEPM
jgi:hypothetical protein